MTTSGDSEGRISSERRGHLFHIGIDRPTKLNGFTPAMLSGLAEAYTAFENDAEARVALVFAHGDNFTAGLDLPKVAPLMRQGVDLFPPGSIDPFDLRPPLRTKPVVAAVRGICFTLGIELMLAADIVVATRSTRFSQLEVKRGVIATGGATLRFVERAGFGNAMHLLLTGYEFDSQTAVRLGFVQEVVDDGDDITRATALAETIAAQAPLAVKAMRAASKAYVEGGVLAGLRDMASVQQALAQSEDAAEGVAAFKEKRDPVFKGR